MNKPLKIIFAGTPEFAVPALAALIAAGHSVTLVLTQPDRPSGRGMKLKASPVKVLAEQHGIAVFQPETLKDVDVQARIAQEDVDVMIVAAYGLIIPTVVLNMPRHGCYNIHASLLPRWRGAAPIQRSILAGDTQTGVTIMEVVPALDAGAMIEHGALPITERDTAQTLHDGLSALGAELMVATMNRLSEKGRLSATPQDESLVTYAHKLQKTEAAIEWNKSATQLSLQIRAFNPFPVAHAQLKDEVCRIWMATVNAGGDGSKRPVGAAPGTIVEVDGSVNGAIVVACGEGLLSIEELQMPGGKRLKAREFLQGHLLKPGDRFN